jgi:superfamily II DNA or RNA helicase
MKSNSVRLKVAERLFPFKRTKILLLDKMEVNLKRAHINQINIESIPLPQVSSDFCPPETEIIRLRTTPAYHQIVSCENINCGQKLRIWIDENCLGKRFGITCPICKQDFSYIPSRDGLIEDLTVWLKEQLHYPRIEAFSVALDVPKKGGKSYVERQSRQGSLFGPDDEKKRCIHGLRRKWCSLCIEKEGSTKEKAPSSVDPFDMIFPVLQPPLGEEFDSPMAFPSGMELYPFQRVGVRFLAEQIRALLGDEMGLGKSIQAITGSRFLIRKGQMSSGLILCPKSVLSDWERKLSEWAPELRVLKVRGPREQREIAWKSPAHLYLTTYETLRQDLSNTIGKTEHPLEDIAKKNYDLVILDEIQKIKNPDADVTKAARQIDATTRWGLSGTPLENRLEELISIFAYLKPGLLHYGDAKSPKKVSEAIRPYFLRRRIKDVLPELPEKLYEEKWLELSPSQREAYNKAEREGIVALNEQGDSISIQHVLALITKLKLICNIDQITKESCKLEYLLEQLEGVTEQGDKALVFSQYPEKTLAYLEPELRRFNPLLYHGALSDVRREYIIKTFQELDDNKILLMSVKAGGLGITLTRANYVFHFDLWWNPSVAEQAEGRVHRIGQTKTVFVNYLFTRNTIEERIENLLKRKRALFKSVIDDLSDTKLTQVLTEEELFGLFGLKKSGERATPETPDRGAMTEERLSKLSPREFEELIGKMYERMGYQVRLTPYSRDRGIDIYAKRFSESGSEYLGVQCKHSPAGVVGVEHARSLYGVIQADPSITKGVLVSSGGFSRDCKEFVQGKRIELFDGVYLTGLLQKYNLYEAT